MIKFILLAKRKQGLSREEFVNYYNNDHLELIARILPETAKCHTRRNFIVHDQVLHPAGFAGEVEFDVVTESIWPDRETLGEFLAATRDASVMAELIADEEKLFERDTMRYVSVEVDETLPE